ncbi:MAG: ornithine cyclodeaminase family protein [Victivallales bacterium]
MTHSHNILFINNKQVAELGGADIRQVIEDVKSLLQLHVEKKVNSPAKAVLKWGTTVEDENSFGRCNAMPCYAAGDINMAGIKWLGSNPRNYKYGLPRASGLMILNDPDTKLPLCIADCTAVSVVRTGAASALAIDVLASDNVKAISIIGAGAQARTQLEGALVVRPGIRKCYVNDLHMAQAEAYAEEMSGRFGIEVVATATAEMKSAIAASEILITATIASTPVVPAEWVHPGLFCINLSDFEYEYAVIPRCDKVVVDDWAGVKHRQISTVSLMYRDGKFKDTDLYAELGEILLGHKPGREKESEITYFDSVGLGAEDLAVITRCYRRAVVEKKGTLIPYWE